jgi:hypothetical protein
LKRIVKKGIKKGLPLAVTGLATVVGGPALAAATAPAHDPCLQDRSVDRSKNDNPQRMDVILEAS